MGTPEQPHPKFSKNAHPPRDQWTRITYQEGSDNISATVPFVADEVDALQTGLSHVRSMLEIGGLGSSGEREFLISGGQFYPDKPRWEDRSDTVDRVVYTAEQTNRFLDHPDPQSWFGFTSKDSIDGLKELRELPKKFHEYPQEE